jgi:aromatic ring-opening dioxygenase catalytic subunit (LigB family)
MALVFAAAASHAPGITAWPDAPPAEQRDAVRGAYAQMHDELRAARVDALIVLTSEHWANFFLDHIGAFCVGRGDGFAGPIEPWLNIAKAVVPGDPALATRIVEAAYAGGVEPSYAYELEFDHGTMLPLHFLTPAMDVPVVPVIFNTLAFPQPTAARCFAFGGIIGDVARASSQRIGIIATGGMSHDPGERNHGTIDSDFDRRFLAAMSSGDNAALSAMPAANFVAAGAGAFELLSWIALRGALGSAPGRVLGYAAATAWATGCGFMTFDAANSA